MGRSRLRSTWTAPNEPASYRPTFGGNQVSLAEGRRLCLVPAPGASRKTSSKISSRNRQLPTALQPHSWRPMPVTQPLILTFGVTVISNLERSPCATATILSYIRQTGSPVLPSIIRNASRSVQAARAAFDRRRRAPNSPVSFGAVFRVAHTGRRTPLRRRP